jgi:hypothetical protein
MLTAASALFKELITCTDKKEMRTRMLKSFLKLGAQLHV